MRKLPIYFLIDVSHSMCNYQKWINQGLKTILDQFRCDPQALETVWISVMTYGNTVKQVMPLTEIMEVQDLAVSVNSQSDNLRLLGSALNIFCEYQKTEVTLPSLYVKGDWKTLLLIFTDGIPNDLIAFNETSEFIKSSEFKTDILVLNMGNSTYNSLYENLTDNVFDLSNIDKFIGKNFFQWNTNSPLDYYSPLLNSNFRFNGNKIFPPMPDYFNVVI